MNEEKIATTTTEPEAENQTKTAKPKRTDAEKLKECYEQKEKLLEQQTAAKKRGREIEKRISENNARIAELENKELLKICKEKKISTQELIGFLKKLSEGTNLENVANTAFRKTPLNGEQLHI